MIGFQSGHFALYFCYVININRFQLPNGLRVVHQFDSSVSTVVLNTLYNVGARDEDENRTGFAHLFEHLMFGGSLNVESFDQEIEHAGGQNNAFTNNEFTNYYITVPLENVETAFWLESDRMLGLNINEKTLSVQKGVVVEEFKQRCFNAPFGQLWHHVRSLLYKNSSYRWPTIGLELDHISDATLDDVREFYQRFYTPQNAIVSIVGNLSLEECKMLCEKWFGGIEKPGEANKNEYLEEPYPEEIRRMIQEDLSPNPAVFILWRGPSAKEEGGLELDLFADMLGGSEVSELNETLVKNLKLCNAAESFYIKGVGEGVFILYGILNEGTTHEQAESELMNTLTHFIEKGLENQFVFESTKNKIYTGLQFEYINPMTRAQKLAYWELLGDAERINSEAKEIQNIKLNDLLNIAQRYLNNSCKSVLYYNPKK